VKAQKRIFKIIVFILWALLVSEYSIVLCNEIKRLSNKDNKLRLKIEIIPDKEEYKIGEKIKIRYILKNISKSSVWVHKYLHKVEIDKEFNFFRVKERARLFKLAYYGGSRVRTPYKELFLLSNYKEIEPGASELKDEQEVILNVYGVIKTSFSYENKYDYYYYESYEDLLNLDNIPVGKIKDDAEKLKLKGAWKGRIFTSREIKVLPLACDEYLKELKQVFKRLSGNEEVKTVELIGLIYKGPSYAGKYFLDRIDKVSAINRRNLIEALCKNMDKGDGFRVMEMLYNLYFNGNDINLDEEEKGLIEEVFKRAIKYIKVKELGYGYRFKEEIAEQIKACIKIKGDKQEE